MHAIDVMLLNMIIVFLLLVMKTIHGCELKRKTEHNMQNKNESDLQGNHHDKRETESHYHDTTDYHIYVKCGSVEMYAGNKCHCGNITLHNIGLSDQYCCVDPAVTTDQCHYTSFGDFGDQRRSDVRCPAGIVKNKLKPCDKVCYNEYTNSKYLLTQSHFYCKQLNQCIHING